jgi:hypothetical protein
VRLATSVTIGRPAAGESSRPSVVVQRLVRGLSARPRWWDLRRAAAARLVKPAFQGLRVQVRASQTKGKAWPRGWRADVSWLKPPGRTISPGAR